jgi:hypothetical protein
MSFHTAPFQSPDTPAALLRDLRTMGTRPHRLSSLWCTDADDCVEDATGARNDAINAVRTALQLQDEYENDAEWRRRDEIDARNEAQRHEVE